MNISRRGLLAAGGALLFSSAVSRLGAAENKRRFRIGACDWSIGQHQQLKALEVAKDLGIDGVQVSFDDAGARYDLRKDEVRKEYAEASQKLGVEICALAMGVMNNVPFATDDRAEKWLTECVRVMEAMGQKIVLLAFFSKGDVRGKPDLQARVIERLKRVAPVAEKAGVVLGFESWLSADDHIRILDAVGSPALKVYYDVANSEGSGYDIYREIRQLGKDRICRIHAKENGFLLGQGKVNFPKVREALDDIGWSGWLVIEGATVSGKTLAECYIANQKYLRKVFDA